MSRAERHPSITFLDRYTFHTKSPSSSPATTTPPGLDAYNAFGSRRILDPRCLLNLRTKAQLFARFPLPSRRSRSTTAAASSFSSDDDVGEGLLALRDIDKLLTQYETVHARLPPHAFSSSNPRESTTTMGLLTLPPETFLLVTLANDAIWARDAFHYSNRDYDAFHRDEDEEGETAQPMRRLVDIYVQYLMYRFLYAHLGARLQAVSTHRPLADLVGDSKFDSPDDLLPSSFAVTKASPNGTTHAHGVHLLLKTRLVDTHSLFLKALASNRLSLEQFKVVASATDAVSTFCGSFYRYMLLSLSPHHDGGSFQWNGHSYSGYGRFIGTLLRNYYRVQLCEMSLRSRLTGERADIPEETPYDNANLQYLFRRSYSALRDVNQPFMRLFFSLIKPLPSPRATIEAPP